MKASAKTLKRVVVNEELVHILDKNAEKVQNLCDYCGKQEAFDKFAACWVQRGEYQSLKNVGVHQPVVSCAMHEPILGFIPPLHGFESIFNTFRIGAAWHNRVSKDDTVGLLDAKAGQLFGKAKVIEVNTGPLADMLNLYASGNHLEIGNGPVGAPERLYKAILQIYGPRIAALERPATVINLERL